MKVTVGQMGCNHYEKHYGNKAFAKDMLDRISQLTILIPLTLNHWATWDGASWRTSLPTNCVGNVCTAFYSLLILFASGFNKWNDFEFTKKLNYCHQLLTFMLSSLKHKLRYFFMKPLKDKTLMFQKDRNPWESSYLFWRDL